MNGYTFAAESDELYEDYDSDEAYDDSDESDELAERRNRGRRVPRINPGKLSKPGGLVRPPAPTGVHVTRAEFNAGMTRIDKKIETNVDAIKKVTVQANKITSELGATTARLEKKVGEATKEVKKQAETSLLLTLLNKAPGIKTTTEKVRVPDPAAGANATREIEIVSKIEVEKQNSMLPLLLLSGQGGLGGGDSSSTLLMALALSGQL